MSCSTRYGLDTVMSAADAMDGLLGVDATPRDREGARRRLRRPGRLARRRRQELWRPTRLRLSIEIDGSDITLDLTGSSPQVETAFNVPFEGSVLPTANFAVRTLFLDEARFESFIPQNEGAFRPIRVYAPLGSIFNPEFPASCFARFSQINRIPDMINLALRDVLPELVVAGSSAAVHSLVYSGYLPEERQYWVYIEVNEGSYGGRFGKDGIDAVDCLMANTRNNPIEELELRQPMLCERYELRDEPPAPGKWRGGIGPVRQWRLLTDTFVGAEGDQRTDPPQGIFGGHDGLSGSLVRNPGPDQIVWPSKVTNTRVTAGDVLRITIPSGGGYGDPLERDPGAVLDDVLDELVPIDDARVHYGVVIDPSSMTVDEDATHALREEKRG